MHLHYNGQLMIHLRTHLTPNFQFPSLFTKHTSKSYLSVESPELSNCARCHHNSALRTYIGLVGQTRRNMSHCQSCL